MMNKIEKYKSLHKLLYLRESVKDNIVPIEDFYISATKLATKFMCDNHTELDAKVSDMLVGIVNMEEKLSFKNTRSMLLDMMNDVDRGE